MLSDTSLLSRLCGAPPIFDEVNARVRSHLYGSLRGRRSCSAAFLRHISISSRVLTQQPVRARVLSSSNYAIPEVGFSRLAVSFSSLAALAGREYTDKQLCHYSTIINSLASNL